MHRFNLKPAYKFPVLIFLLLACGNITSCHSYKGKGAHQYYQVTKVVDGDTFWVNDGTEKGKKVRLIGVDAPETRRTARKEVGYYSQESKKYLTDMLLDQEVRLEYDVDPTDRYGRTLAYAYLKEGTFVNAELVKQGFAMVMTVPPNVRFAEEFLNLQIEARKKQRGLWKNRRTE